MPIQGNILSELLYLFVIVIELQANKRGRVELVPSTQYITSAINFQIYLKDSTTMYSATQSQRNNSTGYWMTCSWSTSLQGMLNTRNSNIMCSFMFIHLQKEWTEGVRGREAWEGGRYLVRSRAMCLSPHPGPLQLCTRELCNIRVINN